MEKELDLNDYKEYFVLDEDTGDLFVRTDLKTHMKKLRGDKVWLLMKIMSFNEKRGDDVEEYMNDIERFENGRGEYYRTRKEYYGMRDALLQALADRDGMICKHCGATDNLSIDHVVAVVNGGKNVLSNLQILCRSCNSKKGAR
jgi:hypothetical protein